MKYSRVELLPLQLTNRKLERIVDGAVNHAGLKTGIVVAKGCSGDHDIVAVDMSVVVSNKHLPNVGLRLGLDHVSEHGSSAKILEEI